MEETLRLLALAEATGPSNIRRLDPDVLDDLVEMLDDVVGAFARGSAGGSADRASRIVAAEIPAYAALARLHKLLRNDDFSGAGARELAHLRQAAERLLQAVANLGEAARLAAGE